MCRKCWSWPSHPTPMTSNTNLKLSRKREASHQRSHLQRCQPGLHNVTGIESSWLASYYWMSDVCDKGIWVLSWVEFWTSVLGSNISVSSPLAWLRVIARDVDGPAKRCNCPPSCLQPAHRRCAGGLWTWWPLQRYGRKGNVKKSWITLLHLN